MMWCNGLELVVRVSLFPQHLLVGVFLLHLLHGLLDVDALPTGNDKGSFPRAGVGWANGARAEPSPSTDARSPDRSPCADSHAKVQSAASCLLRCPSRGWVSVSGGNLLLDLGLLGRGGVGERQGHRLD
jgi:hypothetical protein